MNPNEATRVRYQIGDDCEHALKYVFSRYWGIRSSLSQRISQLFVQTPHESCNL